MYTIHTEGNWLRSSFNCRCNSSFLFSIVWKSKPLHPKQKSFCCCYIPRGPTVWTKFFLATFTPLNIVLISTFHAVCFSAVSTLAIVMWKTLNATCLVAKSTGFYRNTVLTKIIVATVAVPAVSNATEGVCG